jgi:hypothetical protein
LAGKVTTILVLRFNIIKIGFQFKAHLVHLFDIAEEILSAQEKSLEGALRPGKFKYFTSSRAWARLLLLRVFSLPTTIILAEQAIALRRVDLPKVFSPTNI